MEPVSYSPLRGWIYQLGNASWSLFLLQSHCLRSVFPSSNFITFIFQFFSSFNKTVWGNLIKSDNYTESAVHTGEILVMRKSRLAVKQQHWGTAWEGSAHLPTCTGRHQDTGGVGVKHSGDPSEKQGCFKVRCPDAGDPSHGMTPSSTVLPSNQKHLNNNVGIKNTEVDQHC